MMRKDGTLVGLRALCTAALIAPLVVAQSSARQASPGASQQPLPTFTAGVNYIEVDVTVTDAGGAFVRNLSAGDFEVLEDGKRQKTTAFALVDLPLVARPAAGSLSAGIEPDVQSNAAASEGRAFVLVLDDLHVDALRSVPVKEAARQFIQGYVGPNDLVSVIHTSGRADASQEFTPRSSLVLASIEKFMGRKLRSSVLERLDAYRTQQAEQTIAPVPQSDLRLQRVFDPRDVERGRDAETTLETLQRLGDLLRENRGRRKAVVLFSEGIDYDIQDEAAQTRSGISTFTSSSASAVLNRYRRALETMTRANIAIYGIDPRGLATAGADLLAVGSFPDNPLLGLGPTAFQDEVRRAQDSLRVLSEQTGGVASVSSNDLSGAFDRIIRDNSIYYVLGYRSSNTRADGRFRRIDVRVRRPGVQVRARKGYVAPSSRQPAAERTLVTTSVEPSSVLRQHLNDTLPASGLPMSAFAAPFKGAGLKDSVLMGLEIGAKNFKFAKEGELFTAKLEAAVVAIDHQGTFFDGDRYSVTLRLRPDTYDAIRANGVRLLFRLNLPEGRYQLRAAAHALGSGAAGSVHYDVDVPDFDGKPLSMSGIVLTSTSAASMPTARTDPALEALLRHPPAGLREFAATETLDVASALYHDPATPVGTVDIVTTVTSEDGRPRFTARSQLSEGDLRSAPRGYGYLVHIPLTEMTPGTYVLRVQAKSRLAERGIGVRELPFRIRSASPAP